MKSKRLFLICLALLMLTGCAKEPAAAEVPQQTAEAITETQAVAETEPEKTEPVNVEPIIHDGLFVDHVQTEVLALEYKIVEEAVDAAIPDILEPEASGVLVEENDRVKVDSFSSNSLVITIAVTLSPASRGRTLTMAVPRAVLPASGI